MVMKIIFSSHYTYKIVGINESEISDSDWEKVYAPILDTLHESVEDFHRHRGFYFVNFDHNNDKNLIASWAVDSAHWVYDFETQKTNLEEVGPREKPALNVDATPVLRDCILSEKVGFFDEDAGQNRLYFLYECRGFKFPVFLENNVNFPDDFRKIDESEFRRLYAYDTATECVKIPID